MSNNSLLKLAKIIENDENTSTLFKFNNFTKNIELSKSPPWATDSTNITDNDMIKFKYYLEYTHDINVNTRLIEEAVIILSSRKTYHPVKTYLEGLVWDGTPRIDTWLTDLCGAIDDSYIRDVSRKVLCACVSRIYKPGCKFDYMLIMEGSQGIGKSTFFNILAGDFYLDTQFSTNENKKDIIDLMRTAWLIEIADLAGFRKHEIENLRAFVSRKVDRVRLSYARRSEDFPRQCIFVGTHNPSGNNEYLKDDTGNRRFWPVVVHDIDIKRTKEVRDQLWAETMLCYKDEILYIDNIDSLKILDGHHKAREVETPLGMKIEEYVSIRDTVSSEEIIKNVFKRAVETLSISESRSIPTAIGIWMRKNGWHKGTNSKRGYYFREGHQFDEPAKERIEW